MSFLFLLLKTINHRLRKKKKLYTYMHGHYNLESLKVVSFLRTRKTWEKNLNLVIASSIILSDRFV